MLRTLTLTIILSSIFPPIAAADPATLLIVTRSDTNNILTLSYPSMEECDAVADHLAMVRSENKSALGVPGAWKRNFDDRNAFRQEVRMATICIPSANDIKNVRGGLIEKGWYRDIYQKP
jgi:hypothetical protein